MQRVTPEQVRAAPLAPIIRLGFGSSSEIGSGRGRLAGFDDPAMATRAALESAGRLGRRLISILSSLGGSASAVDFAFQTSAGRPEVVESALARLIAAGLVQRQPDGSVKLAELARQIITPVTLSLADQNSITSDELGKICTTLGVKIPGRKQERIDAIAAVFADPTSAAALRRTLSPGARDLLDLIAERAGPAPISSEFVGLDGYTLMAADAARYAYRRLPIPEGGRALVELTTRGIVGVNSYEHALWIWHEAWAFVGQPFYRDLVAVVPPDIGPVPESPSRLPAFASAFDRALRFWETNPPPTLKNGQDRIGKSEVKAAAKAVGAEEPLVDLAGRLAIGLGLLRRNITNVSGRGRNQRVDQAWMGDPTLLAAWNGLGPTHRWARLVAEWFASSELTVGAAIHRHLLIWQLSTCATGTGYIDDERFINWFADHHYHAIEDAATRESLADLRALGVVTPNGPLALTAIGRVVLERPKELDDVLGGAADRAIVQGDLSIIAPPDLRDDLTARLESIAVTESSAGAVIYRLDAARITRTVQGGSSADELVGFLSELSSAPLPDTVVRMVRDAGAKAGTVRVISATTVVVVHDPADLATACSIKTLRLVRVADTVAVTDVPAAKVRTALERKGLTPETIVAAPVAARSTADEAAEVAERAKAMRAAAAGRAHSYFEQEARFLEARAKSLSDVTGRFAVKGPLAATADVVDRLITSGTSGPAAGAAKGSAKGARG